MIAGGIVAYGYGEISNCANYGTINAYGSGNSLSVGGIKGNNINSGYSNITNCINVGRILRAGATGGGPIIGENTKYLWGLTAYKYSYKNIYNCYYLYEPRFNNVSSSIIRARSGHAASFTDADSPMSEVLEEGTDNMNLLDTLNHYTERVDGETVWEIKAGDEYPTIIGSPDR